MIVFIVLAFTIFCYTMVDWYVMSGWGQKDPHSVIGMYWMWQNLTMLMFGVIATTAFWVASPAKSPTTVYITGALLATGFIFAVSGLLDTIYFVAGAGSLPSVDVQWTWMPQYRIWVFGILELICCG